MKRVVIYRNLANAKVFAYIYFQPLLDNRKYNNPQLHATYNCSSVIFSYICLKIHRHVRKRFDENVWEIKA